MIATVRRNALPIVAVVAVLALALAMSALVGLAFQQRRAVAERVTFDMQSCGRGNALRGQIKEMGTADGQLVADVISELIPKQYRQDAIEKVQPAIDKQADAVKAIALTNCRAALERAKEKKP